MHRFFFQLANGGRQQAAPSRPRIRPAAPTAPCRARAHAERAAGDHPPSPRASTVTNGPAAVASRGSCRAPPAPRAAARTRRVARNCFKNCAMAGGTAAASSAASSAPPSKYEPSQRRAVDRRLPRRRVLLPLRKQAQVRAGVVLSEADQRDAPGARFLLHGRLDGRCPARLVVVVAHGREAHALALLGVQARDESLRCAPRRVNGFFTSRGPCAEPTTTSARGASSSALLQQAHVSPDERAETARSTPPNRLRSLALVMCLRTMPRSAFDAQRGRRPGLTTGSFRRAPGCARLTTALGWLSSRSVRTRRKRPGCRARGEEEIVTFCRRGSYLG